MNKSDLRPYVSFVLDDALSTHPLDTLPADLSRTRLVVWQCGFEPMVVAVVSYLPETTVDEETAEELARDFLSERGWFSDVYGDNVADYVL